MASLQVAQPADNCRRSSRADLRLQGSKNEPRVPAKRTPRSIEAQREKNRSRWEELQKKPGAQAATSFLHGDVGRTRFGFSREEFEEPSRGYYEGQFEWHLRHGQGMLIYPGTGDKYVGQFKRDRFDGKGLRRWSDGSTYDGEWHHGAKDGDGLYTSADGRTYEGQWQGGKRHGFGRQEYARQDVYCGQWAHGQQQGRGVYLFGTGDRYEGSWSKGWYDGKGTLFSKDGGSESRRYKNGVLQERGILADSVKSDHHRFVQPTRDVQRREVVHAAELPHLPPELLLKDPPTSPRVARGEMTATS